MTFRLLGMTDEERLQFEEVSGIRTEGARLIVEESVRQTEELLSRVTREVQAVVGPHGSLSRVQAGGVQITPGLGIGVFADGVLKTTIKPDGNLLVGSNIDEPRSTSFCVFVNEQVYNNETMGAGDLLIGDNSSGISNVKFDASEGQLQFRLGQTVNVYMDTDGTLKAGGGSVTLDSDGISLVAPEFPGETFIEWIRDDNGGVAGKVLGWYIDGVASGVYVVGRGTNASHFGVSGLAAIPHGDTDYSTAILFDIDTNGNAELNLEAAAQDNAGEQALVIKTNITETNALNSVLYLDTKSKNTVANGLGTSISFRIEDSAGNMDTAGYVAVDWTDKTSGSEDAEFKVGLMKAGTVTNALTLTHNGLSLPGGEFNFPFATYIDLNPITATGKYPYGGTIEASMSFVKFSISVYTATSHSGSAYYTLTLKARQGAPGADVTVCSVDTKTIVGGQTNFLSTTSFTTGSITGTGYLYLEVTKTSTPADIYILCPSLRCNLT